MKRIISVPFAIVLASGLSGCVMDDAFGPLKASVNDSDARVAATQAAVNPEALAGRSPIPWQLTPASAASRAQGEATVVVNRSGLGTIRGTEQALAQLDQTIVPFQANSVNVTSCKKAFEPQARANGAYSVEAAAAGPVRKRQRMLTQQVFFRIFYADPKDNGVEVRQASIACSVDKRGQLQKAAVL